MIQAFTYTANPARIVFGPGTLAGLSDEVGRAGGTRALILSTVSRKADAEAVAASLADRAAGVFAGAAMHTPVAVTERALTVYRDCGADCVVAYGGGSAIGLGKAIAYRTGAVQVAVATTYAGSEVTPILGQTEDGVKTTIRDPAVLPEAVIYDPELTVGLPVAVSVASGLNAMAHGVEALYAQDRNPVSSLMAMEGLRALHVSLPRIAAAPGDVGARGDALYGAWLCGAVLGTVGMALHHKLCHTLGGAFGTPHAETHAILLPHTAAYNEPAARSQLLGAADLFGGRLGPGLHAFAASLGAPLALKDLGLSGADLDRAADLAVQCPYANPREVTRDAIRGLLERAWDGRSPE